MNPTLTDILWFLFIGGMFFMMLRRGGCCGGHRNKKTDYKRIRNDQSDKQ
jgi:hypothetical protein